LRGLRIAAFRDQLEQLVCGSPVDHRGRLPAFCVPNRRPAACRPTPAGSNCSSPRRSNARTRGVERRTPRGEMGGAARTQQAGRQLHKSTQPGIKRALKRHGQKRPAARQGAATGRSRTSARTPKTRSHRGLAAESTVFGERTCRCCTAVLVGLVGRRMM
jgi:hypothetical protein